MFLDPSRCWTLCIITSRSWSNFTRSDVITRHLNGILLIVTVKGKVHPGTGHEDPEGEKYSYTLSLTSALDGGGWSTPSPGRFIPWKETRYPLYRKLDGPQGRSGRMRKTSPQPGFDPRTVQPVASRYIDCTIPVHIRVTYVKVRCLFARLSSYKDMLRCDVKQSNKFNRNKTRPTYYVDFFVLSTYPTDSGIHLCWHFSWIYWPLKI
jgi:hypothetical protein